jgi:hypothetical protein
MKHRIGAAASCVALSCFLARLADAQDEESALAHALESAECTLGDECERWGPLIEDDGGVAATCLASTEPPTPPVWYRLLSDAFLPDVPCPFGRCRVYDQQLTLDADGSLITLAAVDLPSRMWSGKEGGLWFTRHAPGGALLSSVLWDFSVPPPGIYIERHAALLRDRTGHALFVSSRAVMPFDAPRPLSAHGFSRAARPAGPALFSTPSGWGVSAALGASGDWVVASQRTPAAGESQTSVIRYGRQGRALWNRTWPAYTTIEAVQVTPDRATLVLARSLETRERTLYKLDERGVVSWRRTTSREVVGNWQEPTRVAASKDGAIYVAVLVEAEDFTVRVRVQKLAPNGQRTAAWLLPNDAGVEQTLISDESGEVVLALPGFTSDWLPTIDWHAFEGEACHRTSYAWPSLSSSPPDRVLVHADRRGARFFATPQMIGQLRERGQP